MTVVDRVFLNQTVTSNGTYVHENITNHEVILFWNIRGPITGTLPTIQFALQEVDPSDRITPIGQDILSSNINTTGTGQIILSLAISSLISVIWTVTGTLPSFGDTSLTVLSRDLGNMITVSGPSGTPLATEIKSSISSTSSVASSTTNITLLASNANRVGATIFNDSNTVLYVKLGAVASLTDFVVKLFPQCYWEVPFGWTGRIDGFWSSVNGNARISEFTP